MLMLKRHVQALIDKRAFTKAIGLAADFARRNPDDAAGNQLVAMAEEAAGYTKAAIQTISHAIDLAPGDPSLRVTRARLLLKDHRIGEAIADIDSIIALEDTQDDAHFLDEAIACRDELLARLRTIRVAAGSLRFVVDLDAPGRGGDAPQFAQGNAAIGLALDQQLTIAAFAIHDDAKGMQ